MPSLVAHKVYMCFPGKILSQVKIHCSFFQDQQNEYHYAGVIGTTLHAAAK